MVNKNKIGGYDPDLSITLSIRQDFIMKLVLKDGGSIADIFPAGTVVDLKFYANMDDVISGTEIENTATNPEILSDGILIRIESTIGDRIPKRAEARLTVTYPSSFPNGDNIPWGKCQVGRDD